MIYHLESLTSEIYEDDYEDGIGKSTGCGYQKEKIGKDFDTLDMMLDYLAKHYGLSRRKSDYDIDEDDGSILTSREVADHSNEQNGGWFEPTKDEFDRWKRGELMLYAEDFVIRYHAYEGRITRPTIPTRQIGGRLTHAPRALTPIEKDLLWEQAVRKYFPDTPKDEVLNDYYFAAFDYISDCPAYAGVLVFGIFGLPEYHYLWAISKGKVELVRQGET